MNNDNSNTNFWISYADLMAGLLFVFILLIGAIIVKYSLLENESKILERVLLSEKTKLEKTKKELEAKEFKISNTVIELADVKLSLKDTSEKLKYNDKILKDTIIQNKELETQLLEQKSKLSEQENQLLNKENIINEYLVTQKDYETQVSKQKSENLSLVEKLEITNSTLVQKEESLSKLLKDIREKENLISAFKEKKESLTNEIELLTKEGKIKVMELLAKEERIYEILKLQKDFESKLEKSTMLNTDTLDKLAITQSILDQKEKELSELLNEVILKKNLIMSFTQTNTELSDEIRVLLEKMKLSNDKHEHFSKDLLATKEKIKNLTGIKVKVITLLKQSLGSDMQIDPKNGSIRLSANVLFEEGKHELKLQAKKALEKTVYKYFNTIIENEEINKHIDKIFIEGHTNTKGSFLYNLNLSQQRAYSVMDFLFSLGFDEKDRLRHLVVASGRSYLDPIYNADNIEDKDASRRIEIKFSLKNEEAIKEIEAILDKQ